MGCVFWSHGFLPLREPGVLLASFTGRPKDRPMSVSDSIGARPGWKTGESAYNSREAVSCDLIVPAQVAESNHGTWEE